MFMDCRELEQEDHDHRDIVRLPDRDPSYSVVRGSRFSPLDMLLLIF